MSVTIVGIIANPASGKDIRRLVAHGSVFDNQEKVRIVRRILLGLSEIGIERVCFMPDYYGIVGRAAAEIEIDVDVFPVDLFPTGEQEDSTKAARIMQREGAGCIVVLGGDGTNRAVAKGNGSVPILPVSTGTNNVFPFMVEGTIAGMAAGLVAGERVPLEECTFRSTKIEVLVDGREVDLALVDVVVYADVFTGAKAIWEMGKVSQIFLNRANADSIGLSSIGGQIHCVGPEEPKALYLELGKTGQLVVAAVAPGIIEKLFVSYQRVIETGEEVEVTSSPCVLALDGERDFEVQTGSRTTMRVAEDGPRVVDVGRTMRVAMKRGVLSSLG
jgi:predicted polyphosphate/ATP-dependent NAD kinase